MGVLRAAVKSGGGMSPGGIGALGVVGAGAATAALSGGEKEKGWIVPPGFMAVRIGFNKQPKVDKNGEAIEYGPGIHPHMLFLRGNKHVSVQDQLSSLGEIPLNRGGLTVVHGEVMWGVSSERGNPTKALFKCKEGELGALVVSTCANAFRIVMSTVPPDRLAPLKNWDEDDSEADQRMLEEQELVNKIGRKMGRICAAQLATWGTEMRGLNIKADAPHPFTSIPQGVSANIIPAIVGDNGEASLSSVPVADTSV